MRNLFYNLKNWWIETS